MPMIDYDAVDQRLRARGDFGEEQGIDLVAAVRAGISVSDQFVVDLIEVGQLATGVAELLVHVCAEAAHGGRIVRLVAEPDSGMDLTLAAAQARAGRPQAEE